MNQPSSVVLVAEPSLADSCVTRCRYTASIRTMPLLLYTPETPRRLHLPLGVMVTDMATEHGGTDVNARDMARQVGRLKLADLQL